MANRFLVGHYLYFGKFDHITAIVLIFQANICFYRDCRKHKKRRLKPIIMTSATTILAMVPFLFGNDMGSKLQQPLAVTVIGGMFIGTLVSLYFIPLCYYFLVRNKK